MANELKSTDKPGSTPQDGIPEIHAQESHRKYKLIDFDNTEEVRTALELVEGSKLLRNKDLWLANFKATIGRVKEWCEQRRPMMRMALVDIRSNKVLFYFVPISEKYNLELGGEMTDLEVDLGGSAGIGYVETLQVPERSLDRFVGPRAFLVWDEAKN